MENVTNKEVMNELIEKFEECKNTWVDLPNYVYTDEYKRALINFIEERLTTGNKLNTSIIVMTLHHEVGNKLPYFEFDRN